MQLAGNKMANEQVYSKAIREFLEANNCHAGRRQLIADRGQSSLRP